MGALYCYFSKATGQKDIVIGLPILNRGTAAFKQTVGLFTNIIPARFHFGLDLSFVELMQAISIELRRDYRYQRFPISEINRGLHLTQRRQLFDLVLSYEKHDYDTHFNGSPAEAVNFTHGFDQNALEIYIREFHQSQNVRVDFEYNIGFFDSDEIELIKARFEFLLGEILLQPDVPIRKLKIRPEAEILDLSTRGNRVHPTNSFIEFPKCEQSIGQRFEQQVKQYPNRIAVKTKHYEWTYRELNEKSNQIAHALLEQCQAEEERIALLFEHDAPMLAGMMGVLKAGKTYVPLAPYFPRERLEYIVQDSQVSAILTNEQNLSLAQTLNNKTIQLINIDQLETARNENHSTVSPDTIAYLLYTSGSTGQPKIDRKALPAPDTQEAGQHYQVPRDTLELQLAKIWENVLEMRPIGISDNFFELGGHSLLAISFMAQIEQQFNKHLPLATLFQSATIEQLANQLRLQTDTWSSLVSIQPNGTKPPFFCVPGIGGNVLYFYELAHHLGPEQPVYGLQAVGLSGKSAPFTRIEDMAAHYLKELQTIQPQGPYRIGGHSFGGEVAFEMSLQLQKQGHEVAFLGIFDHLAPTLNVQRIGVDWDDAKWLVEIVQFLERELGKKRNVTNEALQSLDADAQLDYLNKQLKKADCLPPNAPLTQLRGLVNVFKANSQIHYMPKGVTKTPITLFKAEQARTDVFENEPTCGWHKFSDNSVSVQILPGDHFSMMKKPQVQILAAQLKEALEQTEYKL